MKLTIPFKDGQTIQVQESLLDRLLRFVNPKLGQERLQEHVRLGLLGAMAGSYVGASMTRRSLSGWRTRTSDPDAAILPALSALRERSRDLVRNEPLAAGALNTVVTNVVGTGLRLQARVHRSVLGMNDDEADELETQIEREWRLWSESHDCDAARTCTFVGLQDLVFRAALESGDVFVLLPMVERPGSVYATSVQVIEGDRVSNPENKADTATLAGGVEVEEASGAPVRYHIQETHPGALLTFGTKRTWTSIEAFGTRTGRRNVIHLYRPLRPGQRRGVPYFAPVIESLKQLGRYSEAELMAAVVAGFFTVFIKSPGGGDLAPMLPAAEIGGTAGDEDLKLANGAIVGLAPGEEIQVADPKRPNTAFQPFVEAILRQIGVALELPFEILVKHFTSSYSAARAALLEAWKFFNSRRQWLAVNFCQLVYETWLEEAVALGRIPAKGFFSDPLLRKAYAGAEWVGPARGMIDEHREIQAARERIELGVSTRSEETAQITGGDWERKHKQQVKEKRMREADGLDASAAPKHKDPGATPEEKPEGEEESDR